MRCEVSPRQRQRRCRDARCVEASNSHGRFRGESKAPPHNTEHLADTHTHTHAHTYLDARMAAQIEVEFGRVRDAHIHRGARRDVARFAYLILQSIHQAISQAAKSARRRKQSWPRGVPHRRNKGKESERRKARRQDVDGAVVSPDPMVVQHLQSINQPRHHSITQSTNQSSQSHVKTRPSMWSWQRKG